MRRSVFFIAPLLVAGGLLIVGFHPWRSHIEVPEEIVGAAVTPMPLPQPLRLSMPAAVTPPENPCSDLSVPATIQDARNVFADRIREAEERNERVRTHIALPFEIMRGDPARRAVALTIDTGTGGADGIDGILAIAQHYGVPLTFFLTGCWALENPELTQKIITNGHSIANHTLTHRNLSSASDGEAEREIAETDRILRDIVGVAPVLFRKPHYAGGERITALAGRYGMVSVQGYPDFGDTTGWRQGVTAEDVLAFVSRKTVPGAIWVLHNLSVADLRAFEDIVRFLLEEEYALLRVEDLLLSDAEF